MYYVLPEPFSIFRVGSGYEINLAQVPCQIPTVLPPVWMSEGMHSPVSFPDSKDAAAKKGLMKIGEATFEEHDHGDIISKLHT